MTVRLVCANCGEELDSDPAIVRVRGGPDDKFIYCDDVCHEEHKELSYAVPCIAAEVVE